LPSISSGVPEFRQRWGDDGRGLPRAVAAMSAKTWARCLRIGSAGREAVMAQTITRDTVLSVLEHVMFVITGFVLMVVGLGMGVTMVMLPVGLVVGLLGLAMFIGGLFVRMKDS
jgi:hypothetical protein